MEENVVYIVYSSESDNTVIYGVFYTMEKALAKARSIKTDTCEDRVYDGWALIGNYLIVDSYNVE